MDLISGVLEKNQVKKMEKEIKSVDIIPAMFIKYRDDGNVLLKCLQGKETVDRAFEPHIIKKIKDPKYILIGILSGVNTMKLTMIDGSEYKDLFHEKWNVLLK